VTARTRVVVLQHPREATVPIGTARLLELGLSGLERHVGVAFDDESPAIRALRAAGAPPILLYPGKGARDLALEPPATPVTLVVIDGTWWQARKILRKSPALASLPRYALTPRTPSRYRIRREPAPECVSTIEAVVEALGLLEREGASFERLLAPFDAMVEHQLGFARAQATRRRRVREKKPPRLPALRLLAGREPNLVIGYGEANAWPRGTPLGHSPEIVHWAAERPSTGERFEAFIAPRKPFSPSFSHHTGILREHVNAGESWASFAERWSAFQRRGDLLCGWGFYASEVLLAEGAVLPERLDLRRVAMSTLKRRPSDVAGCAALLGEPVSEPWVEGRTGIRLGALGAVLRGLLASARLLEASLPG
jgi:DTW domain-containing protein YfiP